MFRKRLQYALYLLAFAAILQGSISWWSLDVATNQVVRGRVASDLQTNFEKLSETKQRLKTWASQAVTGLANEPQLKNRYLDDMGMLLARLKELDAESMRLSGGSATQLSIDTLTRTEALALLEGSLGTLRTEMARMLPAVPGQDAQASWKRLSEAFDLSEGRDLRTILAQSIAREALAVQRERAAADASLARVSDLAFGATLTLGLVACLFALYFSRALRRPLDELQAGTEALQKGDLSYRIPALRRDEFGKIASTLNALASQLERHEAREGEVRQQLQDQVQARTIELQNALHKLQLMDARRRQLFADISHELRTPTTAIRGEAEVTLRGKDKPIEEYKATLARVVDISHHLGSVIKDLLDLARNDIEALSIQHEAVDIHEVLEASVAQVSASADARSITIENDYHQGTPRVSGDPQRLRQLFTLVLDNAVQYSRSGDRIQVVTRKKINSEGNAVWQLDVVDQGIGIASHELPRVFERKFRGERAKAQREDGSGLGLNIAQTLVRAHDGTILLKSQPGQGTQVTIDLPTMEEA